MSRRLDLDLDGADEWAADTRDRLRQPGGGLAGAAAGRRRVHRRARPRPGRPRPLAAGPGAADRAAAARRAHRAGPGPAARRPPRRRAVLHGLVAAPPRDARRAAARPTCAPRTPTRCCTGCTTRPMRRAGPTPRARPALADPAIARALGVRSSLSALLAEPGGADDLLSRLADPARPVTRPQLRALWSALATAGRARRRMTSRRPTGCARSSATSWSWRTPTTCSFSTLPTCGRSPRAGRSSSRRTSTPRGWPTCLTCRSRPRRSPAWSRRPGELRPVPDALR